MPPDQYYTLSFKVGQQAEPWVDTLYSATHTCIPTYNEYFEPFLTDFEPRQVSTRLFVGPNLLVLKESFVKNPYPSAEEMTEIAKQLNSRKDKIKKWFYYQQRKAVARGEHLNLHNRREIRAVKRFTNLQYMILKKAYQIGSGKIPAPKELQKLAVLLKESDLEPIKKWFRSERLRLRNKRTLINSLPSKSSHASLYAFI